MEPAARRYPPWSDLQPELKGLVLRRLSSLADRVRLRAVCRSWRRDAMLEPCLPPPLPWLTLPDGTFLSIPDGEIHRMPAAPDGARRRCHGSVGNWLLLENIADIGRCSLMNPFSGDVVQLPNLGTIWRRGRIDADRGRPIHLKVAALSSSQDPSLDSLFAVLITDSKYESVISICQPTTATAYKVTQPQHRHVLDIALFDGKLYALSRRKLFVLEMDTSIVNPRIRSMKCIANSMTDDSGTSSRQSFADKGYKFGWWGYLAESSGRLLYVRRLIGVRSTVVDDDFIRMEHARTLSFDVFEADLTAGFDSCGGRWRRVSTLRGQALFVGTHSKSFPASECGAQEDCIYFMRDYDRGNCDPDPLRDSGVFDMRNGMIAPLLPETAVVPARGAGGRPAWFYPADKL